MGVKVSQSMEETLRLPRQGLKRAVQTAQPAAGGAATEEFRPQDVWDWTAGKYRTRSVILLVINILLFAGLACFTYWLRTGRFFAFASDQYGHELMRALNPAQEDQATLIDFLTSAIPVAQVPLMMLIVGLLLASLTAIPILVSMLYRFPTSLIFAAIIGFVAVMPSLAMFVTASCLIARLKIIRFSFRFATALIALLPCVLYYVIATRNPVEPISDLPPVELARLYVPWVIALICACMEMGIVLVIARLVNYRPGAIAPLLAVMFIFPVVLFETQVGRDELYYRLLEKRYGPGSTTHFLDNLSVREAVERLGADQYQKLQSAGTSMSPEQVQELVRLKLILTCDIFEDEKAEAIHACRAFRESFPSSPHIPNALYLEGRAWDLRVDRQLFRRNLIVRYYEDFPHPGSEPIWQTLHDEHTLAPPAAEATYRLSKLKARGGQVDLAIRLLDELIANAEAKRYKTEDRSGRSISAIWARSPRSENLDVRPSAVLIRARRLRELLARNRDPHQDDLALVDLLRCDPHHPRFESNIRRMLEQIPTRYPMTRLQDNLRVLLLVADSDVSPVQRIREWENLIDELKQDPESDALARARFELARTYEENGLSEEASTTYELLIDAHPESAWAESARSRLAAMGVGDV